MVYRQQWGGNKYGAKRTEYNGRKYDSKFEAGVAEELDWRGVPQDIIDLVDYEQTGQSKLL